jgi:uncharacterized membrane protein (Fun14 family)
MSVDVFTSIPATIGGGFIGGLLLGYALKKVVKLIAVVVGLFTAGLAYLQYQHVAYFDWEKTLCKPIKSKNLATLALYLSLVIGAFIAYRNSDHGSSSSDSTIFAFSNLFYFTILFVKPTKKH